MIKKLSQGQKISFYPAYVSVVTAIGYPMYEKRFAISGALTEKELGVLRTNNPERNLNISPYAGFNAALRVCDKGDPDAQRIVVLGENDSPDALWAYDAIYVGKLRDPVEIFDGYGMKNIPAQIQLPISDDYTLEFAYTNVEFSCVFGQEIVTDNHLLCTDHKLHFDSHEESPGLLQAVDKFNQAQGAVIVQKIPILHNGIIWGDDFPTDQSETMFTLAVTDQPTLLLPPSPEGAQRIGQYLVSSGVISR
jgi:hypothetical protein